MGLQDSGFWLVIGPIAAALIRPVQNIILARMALRGTKPSERGKIIDSLAKTRQFSPMQLPRRTRRQVESAPVDQDAP